MTTTTGDGPDPNAYYPLRRRGKRHDYFTSCLPWPQKGTAVSIPLGTQAPVHGWWTGSATNTIAITGQPGYGVVPSGALSMMGTGTNVFPASKSAVGTAGSTAFNATNTLFYADLSTATAATINQLREAFQIQRLFERDARGGTRYTEILRSHFGVISPDARLQRPEYLGGGTVRVNVHAIANTTEGAVGNLGDLAGIGTFAPQGVGFRQSFTEHGVLLGLMSMRADLNYAEGVERQWSRRTRFDYYWPALAHLGEQAVLNKEIYVTGTATDDQVFGYQERHAEYRFKPSLVTGKMRPNATTTLASWHLAQDFSALPVLNESFIQEDPPVDRVVAVTTEPDAMADIFFSYRCARPMPVFGVPGLIDHF